MKVISLTQSSNSGKYARHIFVQLLSRLVAGGLVCLLFGGWLWGRLLVEILPLEFLALILTFGIRPALKRESLAQYRSFQEAWANEAQARLPLLLLAIIVLFLFPVSLKLTAARALYFFIIALGLIYEPVVLLQEKNISSILRPMIAPALLGLYFWKFTIYASVTGVLSMLCLAEAIGTLFVAGMSYKDFPIPAVPRIDFTSLRSSITHLFSELLQYASMNGDQLTAVIFLSAGSLAYYQLSAAVLLALNVAATVCYSIIHDVNAGITQESLKSNSMKMLIIGSVISPVGIVLFLQFMQEQISLAGSFISWMLFSCAAIAHWFALPYAEALIALREEKKVAIIALAQTSLLIAALIFAFTNATAVFGIGILSALQLLRSMVIIFYAKRLL